MPEYVTNKHTNERPGTLGETVNLLVNLGEQVDIDTLLEVVTMICDALPEETQRQIAARLGFVEHAPPA